jgi:hypothetical protein
LLTSTVMSTAIAPRMTAAKMTFSLRIHALFMTAPMPELVIDVLPFSSPAASSPGCASSRHGPRRSAGSLRIGGIMIMPGVGCTTRRTLAEWRHVQETEPATPNQVGCLHGEFARLGFGPADRDARLKAAADYRSIDPIHSFTDLRQGQAGQHLQAVLPDKVRARGLPARGRMVEPGRARGGSSAVRLRDIK